MMKMQTNQHTEGAVVNVLQTHALTKRYGATRAVDALDMHVAEGDIYGFVGKNGAGKSTVMKMAAGLATPTSGDIELFGESLRARKTFDARFSRVGALIEDPGILPNYSAFENLMCKALAIGVTHANKQCRDLINLVGLADAGNRSVKKFSLGMKQRLGLALALVGGPDLLLLDEPFNGMDPEVTRSMRNALTRLNQERGVSMVISSHVLDQLDRMATRFGVIRDGRMVREFSTEELHASCGSSVRVKTVDAARTLAILEERLAGAAFRMEPDGSVLVSASAQRPASASLGGAAADPAASGAPGVEEISRVLHDSDQQVLELTKLERDIEDYFVELMGAEPADANGTSGNAAHTATAPDAKHNSKEA